MKLKISKPFWQAVGFGTLAGMRTASAPAIASHILSHHHSKKLSKSPLGWLQSDKVAVGLKIFALAEFVGDKLPSAPNRTKPIGIIARCLSGSLAGAAIYKASGGNPYLGAVIGSVSALGSTFGSFFLRKNVSEKTKIFDPIIGAIEDALVIGAGIGLVRSA
jgi:uncharacterized membrane protein